MKLWRVVINDEGGGLILEARSMESAIGYAIKEYRRKNGPLPGESKAQDADRHPDECFTRIHVCEHAE